MFKKIFVAVAVSLMLCATAAAQEISVNPVIAVEKFQSTGNTSILWEEVCSDLVLKKLFDSEKFTLLSPDWNEAPKKINPAYLVKGSVEIQTAYASFVKAIIDFELVDAKTGELVWGRRVWHKEPAGNGKRNQQIIYDTIYRTVNKVVGRLTVDIESGTLALN